MRVPRSARMSATAIRESIRRHPDRWALLTIVAAVVLANGLYLLGIFVADPLGPRSGLVSAVKPGRLVGLQTIDPSNGLISQSLGHRAVLDWLHLRIPWWNPYNATGSPLAGEMESAALFPLTVLTIFSNGQLYEHLLMELLSGCATYLLLRRISVGRLAGLAGGIVFGLDGTFAWFAHSPVNPIAFLPLLLLGIELAYAAVTDGRKGGWWLIAIAGALSVYGGFPEVAYIDGLLGVFWIGWRCGCLERARLRAFAAKVTAGALAGVLLAGPLLIAFLDYVNHADLGPHSTGGYANAHLAGHALPSLVLPYVYGPIFAFANPTNNLSNFWGSVGGYLSTSLLLFGLLGLLSKGRGGLRLVLLAFLVLVFARMYGVPPGLGHVLGVLPDMANVAFYRYAWPALELSVVVLAAIGLDDVIKAPPPPRRLALAGLIVAVVVIVAALGAHTLTNSLGHVFNEHPFYRDTIIWGAGILVAGVVASLLRQPRVRRVAAVAVLVLDAGMLFVVPELSAPRSVSVDLAPVAYLRAHIGNGRFYTLGPLSPNYGSYFGLSELDINDIPVPAGFRDYLKAHLDPYGAATVWVGSNSPGRSPSAPSPLQELIRNLAGYRAAAVDYVLAFPGQTLPQSAGTFQLVDRTPSTWIYHLSGSDPYFTATNPRCVIPEQTKESLLLGCPGSTELTKRELDMPGWSADVDGRPVAVHKTAEGWQQLSLGPGVHRISFAYTPPTIWLGFVGLVLGLGWLLIGPLRRRRRR